MAGPIMAGPIMTGSIEDFITNKYYANELWYSTVNPHSGMQP